MDLREEDGYISEEDEDYVPEADADIEDANDLPYDDVDDDLVTKAKRKKSKTKAPDSAQEITTAVDDPEAQKKKIDALWDAFLSDTTPSSSTAKTEATITSPEVSKPDDQASHANGTTEPKTKTVTEVFDFAGEEVKVERTITEEEAKRRENKNAKKRVVATTGLGLANLADYLAKKPKMTTLDKSSLDWKKFVKEKGIEDELKSHNRGKDSYLDKTEFLARADYKQFEKEKHLRNQQRPK
ncbi:Craniofacial development protein 1/Bucentaur [Aphelenchoides avenae]|nr:Craniofacial development protein 1/Bucentaur [Aphelenchus avenae]